MEKKNLYDPFFEHDSCGVGFVANINGAQSHSIVKDGITILMNLVHRGAIGGDLKTGDGAGMLTQVPHEFFVRETGKKGIKLPAAGEYGVGMLFLPSNPVKRKDAVYIIETVVKREGAKLLGWRDVPVRPDCLGELAKAGMPFFSQVFVAIDGAVGDALERKLYVLRKCIENEASAKSLSSEDFYIPSFSCRTVNYKGMFVAPQFATFFPDLLDEAFTSAIALVHQRYSTNTLPSWHLAQPFRCAEISIK
jgi:glutamate synthase domain-containing protein 1